MPAALSMGERRQIVAMREAGQSFRAIAAELGRDYEAVRRIYQRYRHSGQLEANYEACRHQAIRCKPEVYERAVQLKQAHPKWGAGLIWVELTDEFDEADLPSQRTLQRWFKRAGVQAPPPERAPKPVAARGQRAHEVWAMDAKEQVELADGSYVSWLTVTDEGSGAILGASLFPYQTLGDHRPVAGEDGTARPDALLGASREDPHG